MANAINDFLKTDSRLAGYSVSLEKLTATEYIWQVDLNAENHIHDYNERTERFNVLKVFYPEECYALPRYLTTRDLSKIFNRSDKTYIGFMNGLADFIEI